jgi:Kef-type K+ transport system membrane component KefB
VSGGIAVLLGLLVVAFVSSMLVGGRTIRGFGLPSGAEYLVLGVAVGPHGLGLVPRSTADGFEPIVVCGAAWLALVAGLGYFIVGQRRVRFVRAVTGILGAAFVGTLVAVALFLTLDALGISGGFPRLELALGAGFVGSETTRHTVRWVAERHGARGPLSDWLADMARASALVPVVGLGILFAIAPDAPLGAFAVWWRVAVTLGIGVVMGLVAAVLLGREFRRDESWGILLGTSLLAAGVATRLGLAAVATLFAMGLTLSVVSRHRLEIKFMVQPTEKPVLLPVVIVVGSCVDFDTLPQLWLLVGVALAARLVAEFMRGALLAAFLPAARAAGPRVGLGMASSGAISLALAFTFSARLPGPASSTVLLLAATGVLLGEFIGPAELRRALERAGETHAFDAASDVAPLSLPSPALQDADSELPERTVVSDFPEGR